MKAKERHKINLLKVLGDPETPFPSRGAYPGILGIIKKTLYYHFTPEELSEIEDEAVSIRRKACSKQRVKVLDSLFERATGYSHPAVHVLSNRVKEYDKEGNLVGEHTEPLLVDIEKHYPPDKAAAQEFLDRVEGKVIEKTESTVKLGEDTKKFLEQVTNKAEKTWQR